MTKYDALIRDFKKAIMDDGHYLVDIVTAAAKQRERMDYVKERWGLTEEEAMHHQSLDTQAQQDYRKRLARAKARAS